MTTFEPRLDILPTVQRQLWSELKAAQETGFVLYGGTAIALRLGHRQSVGFDFFSSGAVDRTRLRQTMSFLQTTTVLQDHDNTFEVMTTSGVKISFFGGLEFGRVGEPDRTADEVMVVASLDDLMATKVKVILQRSEAKDYQDIAAMVRAGVRVDVGLAAAEKMYHPTFPPIHSLKALVYFEGGDMQRLAKEDRQVLIAAANQVRSLPEVKMNRGLLP